MRRPEDEPQPQKPYCLHCALSPEVQRALSEERLSVNEALFKLTEIQAELIAGVGDARARKQLRDSVAVELRRMTIAAREDRIEAGTPDFETVSQH